MDVRGSAENTIPANLNLFLAPVTFLPDREVLRAQVRIQLTYLDAWILTASTRTRVSSQSQLNPPLPLYCAPPSEFPTDWDVL